MRLNQDRQNLLEPIRIDVAENMLTARGYIVERVGKHALKFKYNGNDITFYPYSGWHTGKGIKDGRGLHNLLKQLVK